MLTYFLVLKNFLYPAGLTVVYVTANALILGPKLEDIKAEMKDMKEDIRDLRYGLREQGRDVESKL